MLNLGVMLSDKLNKTHYQNKDLVFKKYKFSRTMAYLHHGINIRHNNQQEINQSHSFIEIIKENAFIQIKNLKS